MDFTTCRPYVLRHEDGFYYFTVSVPVYDCIILRRAKNLWELKDTEEHIKMARW